MANPPTGDAVDRAARLWRIHEGLASLKSGFKSAGSKEKEQEVQ